MITIQIPGQHQEAALRQFIAEHRLARDAYLPEESMILMEDGKVLGYAAYRRKEAEAVVTMLFIDPAMRKAGFGDGLFRGTINLMERNGIHKFYVPAAEACKGFLEAEDLTPCSGGPDWADHAKACMFWFEGSLPEFFQKPCKGGRHT